jgi:hypothetical protein
MMLWRRLCQVRAWSAAGLLACILLPLSTPADEPAEPLPGAESHTTIVNILDAQKSGDLEVIVRGGGEDHVQFTLKNHSPRRLNVVLPPGLVAAASTSQAGGGGGGLQSMGLGQPDNPPGAFGQFQANPPETGLRAVEASPAEPSNTVAVPSGQTVEFNVPSVCLNFGLRTPTPRDIFRLVAVEDYSTDPRVQKALKTLATTGTSRGVAQAAMWNVCNGLPFEQMAAMTGKYLNVHEIALAARLVEALDASGSSDQVDPAYLTEGRLFIRIRGEGTLAREAKRLGPELDGLRIMGLPARHRDSDEALNTSGPALDLRIVLTGEQKGKTEGRLFVHYKTHGRWQALGQAPLVLGSAAVVLDGPELARELERIVSSTFVTVKPTQRRAGSTTLRVVNHLPFSVAHVIVKAGQSAGAPSVTLSGLGIGPARAALASIQAATATVERVELNGL